MLVGLEEFAPLCVQGGLDAGAAYEGQPVAVVVEVGGGNGEVYQGGAGDGVLQGLEVGPNTLTSGRC